MQTKKQKQKTLCKTFHKTTNANAKQMVLSKRPSIFTVNCRRRFPMPSGIQQRSTDTRIVGHGNTRSTARDTDPPAAKRAKTPQKANPAAPQPTSHFRIKQCTFKVKLFPDPQPKNRRMTTWEYEQELEDAKCWLRVPRTHILDKPTYPWVPQVPKYTVNFDLNAPQ
ncbi:MAG: hypothetical protein [Anelloviridae sp.]|nr:MAG: hypothetical protein [Anelloviridae sp.]